MPRNTGRAIEKGEVVQKQKALAESKKIEFVMLGGGVLLLLLLIYTIQSILSPFVLFGSVLFLLYPLRSNALVLRILWLASALFALWFFYTIGGILAPFVISLLAAYILHPIVAKVESWGIPRWASSLFIILFFLGVLTIIIFLVFPLAFQQFEGILQAVNSIANDVTQWLLDGRIVATLNRYGISSAQMREMITANFAPRLENIMKGLLEGAFGLVSGISSVISRIVNMVIIPFLSFYVLKDFPLIKHRFKLLLPRERRERAIEYYGLIDELLGRYLRGAITVAFINAVAVAFLFWIFGIQYPLVMGIVAGVLDLIPYFGLLIMLVLSVIVAFFSGPPVVPHVILAASTVAALHILEAAVLSPKIIGSKVGIHPALLILSLLIFSFFLGFIGLLIAVPTTAILILVIREQERSKRSEEQISPILEDRMTNENAQ